MATERGGRTLVAAMVALAVGLAACGVGSDDGPRAVPAGSSTTDATSSTERPPTKPPVATAPTSTSDGTGGGGADVAADQVVWQERTGGGFVPLEVALAEIPQVTIYADGRTFLVESSDEPAQGGRASVVTGTVPAATLAAFLRDVERSELFGPGPIEFGTPLVTDGPTTSVTFHPPGRSPRVVGAYFLHGGFDRDLAADEVARRKELRALLDRSYGLAQDLRAWTPDRVQVIAPDQGATSESPTTPPWPGPPPADLPGRSANRPGYRCGEVSGAAAADLHVAAEGNPSSAWLVDGEVRVLVVTPLLPGAEPCPQR